ncbi:MAG: GGDEF domain-containing protein [Pirellula sp.]|nr:GGDEF domain-containing protein [Pirellula sp.]
MLAPEWQKSDDRSATTGRPLRVDSVLVTAMVCAIMIGMTLLPDVFPSLPSQWRMIGIAGLVSCIGLSELRRRNDQKQVQTLTATCTVDSLTGLDNERGLYRELHRQLSYLRREGAPISVLMMEVDRFDAITERWGQQAANAILRDVSQVALAYLRELDLLTRFRGQQMVAILPATKLSDAESVAERIRKAVEETVIAQEKLMLDVTVSIGVAAAVTLDTETSLLARAKAALQNAHRMGPNHTCSQSMNIELEDVPLTCERTLVKS